MLPFLWPVAINYHSPAIKTISTILCWVSGPHFVYLFCWPIFTFLSSSSLCPKQRAYEFPSVSFVVNRTPCWIVHATMGLTYGPTDQCTPMRLTRTWYGRLYKHLPFALGVCTVRPPCAKIVCAVGSDGHVTKVEVVDWWSSYQRPFL